MQQHKIVPLQKNQCIYLHNIFIFISIINHQMSSFDLKNVRGGGLQYVSDFTSTETKVFRGGMRHYPYHQQRMIYGQRKRGSDYHDKISYERGLIVHSRSFTNQQLNFQYMFGGFQNYIVKRYWKDHLYRKIIRRMWVPALLYYTFCCYGMRQYDNAAHDFFYFSD